MARKKNATRSDGRIAVQVYLGRDENGKRKYKTVYGSTQKEANAKAAEVKAKIGKGLDVLSERNTFGEWRRLWWSVKKNQISAGTQDMYKTGQKWLSRFEYSDINKIRTADIELALIDASKEHLSKHTLTVIRMTAIQIFDCALDNRVIEYNPAARAKIPDGKQETRRALTDEEQRMIRDTPHRAQTAAMIMMYAGLRRGELLALTWSDIDLDAKTITVNKSVEMIKGQPHVKQGTKTESGNRVIVIPQILIDYLRTVQQKTFIVCPSTSGRYMSATAWKRLWESYMAEINVKYGPHPAISKYDPHGINMTISFTAHCLRHTYATLLYKSGVDTLTAQYLLGHANIKTTLGVYTHLDAEIKQRSVAQLDNYLSKNNDASQMQVK